MGVSRLVCIGGLAFAIAACGGEKKDEAAEAGQDLHVEHLVDAAGELKPGDALAADEVDDRHAAT